MPPVTELLKVVVAPTQSVVVPEIVLALGDVFTDTVL